jgi:hypothetical protein
MADVHSLYSKAAQAALRFAGFGDICAMPEEAVG